MPRADVRKWVPLMGAIPLADNAYLKRRRGKRHSGFRWYVRVSVPTDIHEIIRKQTIERALNTSDIKEARKLKLTVLAEIFESFERARITSRRLISRPRRNAICADAWSKSPGIQTTL